MNATCSFDELLADLSGTHLIRQGLAERVSVESCLVGIVAPRLRRVGLLDPTNASESIDAELTLYRLLGEHETDAYGRYSSLLRELVSFENAFDRRLSRGFFRHD